jgi:hypothetical protein
MAGADKSMESSFWFHNFNIAYVVKFFGPSASLAVENKPNKVRTRFFRFLAVSHVPARRAISPAANSLSLRSFCFAKLASRSTPSRMIMASDPGGTHGFPSRRAAQNKPERPAAVPERVRSSGCPSFPITAPHVDRRTPADRRGAAGEVGGGEGGEGMSRASGTPRRIIVSPMCIPLHFCYSTAS